jgi:hypothetical protein
MYVHQAKPANPARTSISSSVMGDLREQFRLPSNQRAAVRVSIAHQIYFKGGTFFPDTVRSAFSAASFIWRRRPPSLSPSSAPAIDTGFEDRSRAHRGANEQTHGTDIPQRRCSDDEAMGQGSRHCRALQVLAPGLAAGESKPRRNYNAQHVQPFSLLRHPSHAGWAWQLQPGLRPVLCCAQRRLRTVNNH